MYWPKEGSETYGNIQVRLLCEVVMATYTLRTFTIRNLKLKKRAGADRTVYQYHYTNWPDHGVPDHPLPVLSFVRKSAMSNPPGAGAIICHCSAGCGRSGTYIVIDAMLKQIRHKQSINVVDFLKHIRTQRNYLVQTEEQYIFIHDALVEAIESGETEIPLHLISKYIQMLQTGGGGLAENGLTNGATKQLGSNYSLMNGLCQSPPALASNPNATNEQLISMSNSNLLATNGATLQKSSLANSQATTVSRSRSSGQWSLLERQYRLAVSFKAKDFCVVSALKPCNRHKNRTHDLIPLEAHRVHITPKPGSDGSDYINATFLMGFNHLHEFIVTQHPIQETFSDFWQMVYDHNSRTIVLLTQMGAPNDPANKEFPQFWPQKEDEVDYGSFKVKLIQESTLMKTENGGAVVARDFIMRSNQDDYELQTRIIHCPGWPHCCGQLSTVFELIQVVYETAQHAIQGQHQHDGHRRTETVTVGQEHEPQNGGPIIVVDKFGGTEASTFAVLTTLFKQINYESHADVYMYAKLAHLRRPAIWPSQDDYLFLYRAIENYATGLLQKQQQQQQHASDSKQAATANLASPISLANLHHHQTMTLDRHRAHKSSPSINKSSTMRRNVGGNNQKQQPNQPAPFVNHPTTLATTTPTVSSKSIVVTNNRQNAMGGGELVVGYKQQAQLKYQPQQQQHPQYQTFDQNQSLPQYSPALVMQTNDNMTSLMGSANRQASKGSPYNSVASIGTGSHQHLLATNTSGGRPVAAVSANQALVNQTDHYALYASK
jgi:protein tyrosine phosphatase